MIPITPAAGAESNAISVLVVSGRLQHNPPHATTSGRNRYGNGVFGNMSSVIKRIGNGTWITSITTRSSMAIPTARRNGRTARLVAVFGKGGIHPIGEPGNPNTSRTSIVNNVIVGWQRSGGIGNHQNVGHATLCPTYIFIALTIFQWS